MTMNSFRALILLFVLWGTPVRAGLSYTDERLAELPTQWRGFLLDQRLLRTLAQKPTADGLVNPLRAKYEAAALRLETLSRERPLTADEAADLGAVHIRLGDIGRALDVLRTAQRTSPRHFRVLANLGTAWQLHGDLARAAAALEEAVRLAPEAGRRAEEMHLKLVRFRQTRPNDSQQLDDLFGVQYGGVAGAYQPGHLTVEDAKKLPADAANILQQLALWLPADGPLLWQIAELAATQGDMRTAAAMLDGCVGEFGMSVPELRRHRQLVRAAVDAPTQHETHAGGFKPRSSRPLLLDALDLEQPAVSATSQNPLPWTLLSRTTIDRQFRPTYTARLAELDGKKVVLSGFMQPLGDTAEASSFMLIEYPVGCWYCEMPEMNGIVFVELPEDKSRRVTRGQIKVAGKLVLNRTDPENFLYTITAAVVAEVD